MDPKNKSSVTHSRGTCVCDHCGLKLNRHNLKAHKAAYCHYLAPNYYLYAA